MKTYTLEEIKDNFFKVKSTNEILEDVKKIGLDLEGIISTFYDELRARDVIIQLANDLEKAIEALKEMKQKAFLRNSEAEKGIIKKYPTYHEESVFWCSTACELMDIVDKTLKELGVE